MQLKELFTDDSAVSPVIGVILMVAITVILAAVIGSFVLNLGGSLQQNAPQANFEFDYPTNSSGEVENTSITHTSGDTISSDANLKAVGPDGEAEWPELPASAGDSMTFEKSGNFSSGDTLRVVWSSTGNETSATLSQSTAP